MAKSVKRVAAPRRLSGKKPVAKGRDGSVAKTGTTIFQKADAGNRRLGQVKKG